MAITDVYRFLSAIFVHERTKSSNRMFVCGPTKKDEQETFFSSTTLILSRTLRRTFSLKGGAGVRSIQRAVTAASVSFVVPGPVEKSRRALWKSFHGKIISRPRAVIRNREATSLIHGLDCDACRMARS